MVSVPGLALIIAMAAAGCSGASPVAPNATTETLEGGSSSPGAATATAVELRFDETVEILELQLNWLELEDSRCPIGVTCFWEGQIVATFEVARGEEGPIEVELILRPGTEPAPARAFDHELLLLGVDPHPKEGKTPERGDYLARVEVVSP